MKQDRLITLKEVSALTTLSKPTIYKRLKEGNFPKQIKVGRNRVAWSHREIFEWIALQASMRPVG